MTETPPDPEAETDTKTEAETGMDTKTDTEMKTETETETKTETDTGESTDMETDTDTDTDESDDSNETSTLPLSDGYETMTAYLVWGTVAVLFLLGVVAVVGLYRSVGTVINIWIAPDYRPIFRTGFNLAVVLACATALSVLVRRLNDARG